METMRYKMMATPAEPLILNGFNAVSGALTRTCPVDMIGVLTTRPAPFRPCGSVN